MKKLESDSKRENYCTFFKKEQQNLYDRSIIHKSDNTMDLKCIKYSYSIHRKLTTFSEFKMLTEDTSTAFWPHEANNYIEEIIEILFISLVFFFWRKFFKKIISWEGEISVFVEH